MAQVVMRPGSVYSSLAPSISALQEERYRAEQARQADRDRQKRLGLTLGIGAATLGAGLIAAPALGLAGAAAAPGFAAGGTFIPGAAATTGLLGAGGAVGLAGGLTLAGLGMGIGGAIANEDYAGAGQQIASAGAQFAQAQQDQSTYGYIPSALEKASYARAAEQSGTNLGALRQTAAQRGITVPQALQEAQKMYPIQQAELEATSAAMKSRALFESTRENITRAEGSYEMQPDQQAFDQSSSEYQSVMDQVRLFDKSGGAAGRPLSEVADKLDDLVYTQQKALQGRPRPKGPQFQYVDPKTGKSSSIPYGIATPVGGKMVFPHIKSDGDRGIISWDLDTETKEPGYIKLPPGSQERIAAEQEALDSNYLIDRRDGTKHRRNKDGTFEPIEKTLTPIEEVTQKATNEALKAVAAGNIGIDEVPNFIAAALNGMNVAEQLEQVKAQRSQLSSEVLDFAGAMQNATVPMESALSIGIKVAETFGDTPPANVRDATNAILEKAKFDAQAITQKPVVSPPPGSAAAAEGEFSAFERFTGKVKRGLTAKARESSGRPAMERLMLQNIQAGIDEPVFAIDARGMTYEFTKGSVTPEVIAEQKANGRTFPGME